MVVTQILARPPAPKWPLASAWPRQRRNSPARAPLGVPGFATMAGLLSKPGEAWFCGASRLAEHSGKLAKAREEAECWGWAAASSLADAAGMEAANQVKHMSTGGNKSSRNGGPGGVHLPHIPAL